MATEQSRRRQGQVWYMIFGLLIIVAVLVLSESLFRLPRSVDNTLAIIIAVLLTPIIYFIPSLVAARRNHRNFAALCCLNAFLGWTFLGWVAALVWALVEQERAQ